MGKQWFVATAKAGGDSEAARNLRAQGYSVYLPKAFSRPADTRKLEPIAHLRFNGYVFVAFDAARDEHGPISNTRGVDELLLNAYGNPQPLPHGVVEGLQEIEDEDFARARARKKPLPRVDLRAGDQVKIDRKDHPAHGLEGLLFTAAKGMACVLIGVRMVTIGESDLKKVVPKARAA